MIPEYRRSTANMQKCLACRRSTRDTSPNARSQAKSEFLNKRLFPGRGRNGNRAAQETAQGCIAFLLHSSPFPQAFFPRDRFLGGRRAIRRNNTSSPSGVGSVFLDFIVITAWNHRKNIPPAPGGYPPPRAGRDRPPTLRLPSGRRRPAAPRRLATKKHEKSASYNATT